MNPTQFAQSIKAKYPQYTDVDDLTLARKMVEKYPSYASKVQFEAPLPDNRDFLQKATDVVKASPFGIVAPLGEAVGRSVGAIGQSIKERSFKPIKAAAAQNNEEYGKIVGSTAGSVALPASLAVGGGASVVANAARVGGLAAAQGGAQSLAEGNDLKTAAIDSFKSSLTGAAFGAGTKLVANGLSKLAEKTPEALYNNALKIGQKLKLAGKSPAAFLADKKVWGNLGTFHKAAQEGIETENAAISTKLATVTAPAPVYDDVQRSAVEMLEKSLGGLYTKPQIQQLIDDVPVAALKDTKTPLNWEAVNQVRSKLGTLIGDSKWLTTTPSPNTKAAQAVYRVLADQVQSASGTQDEFARLSKWIQTSKVVSSAIAKADSKYGLGLYDYVAGGVGAATGFGSGDDMGTKVKNAIIGGGTALAAERTLNSPATKTAIAQVIQHLGDLPTDTLGRVSRAAVLDLISRLMATNPEDQPSNQEQAMSQ